MGRPPAALDLHYIGHVEECVCILEYHYAIVNLKCLQHCFSIIKHFISHLLQLGDQSCSCTHRSSELHKGWLAKVGRREGGERQGVVIPVTSLGDYLQ